MIVGLSGYARVGKDTAAEALMKRGFVRVAFADQLLNLSKTEGLRRCGGRVGRALCPRKAG